MRTIKILMILMLVSSPAIAFNQKVDNVDGTEDNPMYHSDLFHLVKDNNAHYSQFMNFLSHAEEFQYWDDLDENSKTEIIKSIDVDKNIMKLYLHKIKLSDNDMSATILDTLSSSTDGYKRMLHFYILNEIVNTADGAVAEMVSGYCVKYVNENTDYALEYFSKHQDVAINYVYIIAGELYLSDTSFTQYEQLLFDSAKSKCAKEYLPTFLKEIKRILAKINL